MKLFYCYSPNLKKFLVNSGVSYLHVGEHQETKRKFWVFEGNEKLNNYLTKWRENKNK